MHRGVIIIAALLVAGCATSKTVYLPDGSKGYAVNCDGSAGNWGMCYSKAGQLCKEKGYTIHARDGEDAPLSTAGPHSAFSGSIVTRSLVISCGGQQGK